MGSIVDNTRSRWGHYKPWITGAIASAVCTLLLFTDLGLPDAQYVAAFACSPAVGADLDDEQFPTGRCYPRSRSTRSSASGSAPLTKIFATIGLFSVVVAIIPVTGALGVTPEPGSCSPPPWPRSCWPARW